MCESTMRNELTYRGSNELFHWAWQNCKYLRISTHKMLIFQRIAYERTTKSYTCRVCCIWIDCVPFVLLRYCLITPLPLLCWLFLPLSQRSLFLFFLSTDLALNCDCLYCMCYELLKLWFIGWFRRLWNRSFSCNCLMASDTLNDAFFSQFPSYLLSHSHLRL